MEEGSIEGDFQEKYQRSNSKILEMAHSNNTRVSPPPYCKNINNHPQKKSC